MRELVEDSQETEVVLAMHGALKVYEVREPFHKFQLEREEWFRMNKCERRNCIKDIYSKPMEEIYASESNASVHSENSDRHRVRNRDAQELSVKTYLTNIFCSLFGKKPDDYYRSRRVSCKHQGFEN